MNRFDHIRNSSETLNRSRLLRLGVHPERSSRFELLEACDWSHEELTSLLAFWGEMSESIKEDYARESAFKGWVK